MELFFLALLVLIMAVALGTGYPVAFALPGAAILSIAAATGAGYIFAGDPAAYFAQGDGGQWLSAGVLNLRGVYWEVERDTLIAIPLFIFMGIMLQRSKIAEDLLITMAQLFGPVPGRFGHFGGLCGCAAGGNNGYSWRNSRRHGVDFASSNAAKQLFEVISDWYNRGFRNTWANYPAVNRLDHSC